MMARLYAQIVKELLSMLRDPKSQVRVWAVHSLSCESCKDGPNPIDAVPLLLERIEMDESVKVRPVRTRAERGGSMLLDLSACLVECIGRQGCLHTFEQLAIAVAAV